MLGNMIGYLTTTCMILLVGGCVNQAGSFHTDPSAAAGQAVRPEDFDLELPEKAAESSGEAVKSLLKASREELAAGETDRAAANLERALSIEPRNPFLYSQLAILRIKQERYSEAEALALKSNSLATQNAYLQERNWRLIAKAREEQGDNAGAQLASERAGQLREFIKK